MSGHSKWSTIKHKKSAQDQRRGKLFSKLLRAVEVAAREGGPNPEGNPTLASAVQKAKEYSVPGDNIDRAIKRGSGALEGARYEEVVYEGYAPGGVAILVHTLTDNRNRASAEVRNAFTKRGGSMGDPGSVSFLFERRGVIRISRDAAPDEERLGLAADFTGVVVTDVDPRGPAAQAGIQPHDSILLVDGQPVLSCLTLPLDIKRVMGEGDAHRRLS